jgi:hypothetical protein
MDESRGGSRIVYPKLLATLTEADLASQFRLAPEERAWAGTAARRGPSMVVLLTQLKVFQNIGHFLPGGRVLFMQKLAVSPLHRTIRIPKLLMRQDGQRSAQREIGMCRGS